MDDDIPHEFGEPFLEWFRQRTEAAWAMDPPPAPWQQGARWLGGLEEEQIVALEHAWGLRFPPDYRLFLRRLHAVDRPMRLVDYGNGATTPTPRDVPAFPNWLTDGDILGAGREALVSGIQFDVEHADVWRPDWGPRPATVEARAQRVQELVEAAPRLIPVHSHRYLLAEPCQAGNPVFSIVQTDIIVYGADLRGYFLDEFADLLGLDQDATRRDVNIATQARYHEFMAIPFWWDLLEME
jgi:hypothetical protein